MRCALLFLLAAAMLRADGGKLILQGNINGETISVFADPFPLKAGQTSDLSVLIQREEEPVLVGTVVLIIGDVAVQATHKSATNKLLFAASVLLPKPGRFPITVTHGTTHISGEIVVLDGAPGVVSYWPYFAALPTAIGLFALNRYLKRRRERVISV